MNAPPFFGSGRDERSGTRSRKPLWLPYNPEWDESSGTEIWDILDLLQFCCFWGYAARWLAVSGMNLLASMGRVKVCLQCTWEELRPE